MGEQARRGGTQKDALRMITRVHPSPFRCSNWNPFEEFKKRQIAVNLCVFMGLTQASQASDVGSIPIARSINPDGSIHLTRTFPITSAGSNGRCNTIWYKAVFKGDVYETRKTVWAFSGAKERRVASLEGRTDAA